MRILVDEALQDAVAHQPAKAGHDVTHIRLLGLAGHADDEIMALALDEDRLLVTTETGPLLDRLVEGLVTLEGCGVVVVGVGGLSQ